MPVTHHLVSELKLHSYLALPLDGCSHFGTWLLVSLLQLDEEENLTSLCIKHVLQR